MPGALFDLTVPGLLASVFLRAGTSDLAVFNQVICSGETDFNLDCEPRFIIDAGANIGLSSIVLATRYPSCKIVALEVDGANFELLCKNVRPYPNVQPVKKALWSTDGSVKISNPTAEAWAFQVVSAEHDDPDAIAAISLKTLLEESGAKEISLLKLDIEGAELDILKGQPENWIGSTRVLAIELHDRFRPGCSDALENMLTGRQYREYQQGEYRVLHFA
jgi:FkbM family methyltransferase